MANWDDEDYEGPGGGVNSPTGDAWEGEDEGDVLDDWDASEEEEGEGAPGEGDQTNQESKGAKKKLTRKEKEAKEAERQRLREEAEEISESKKRQLQQESDLAIAMQTMGVSNSSEGGLLESFDPQNLKDFTEFSFHLCNKLMSYKDSPHFYLFCEGLFRELGSSLNSEDTRKLSTMLLAMSSEKVKREKESQGKKPKKKGKPQSKQVGSAISEYDGFGDGGEFEDLGGEDDEDFM